MDTMENSIINPKKERISDYPGRYIHIGYPKSGSTALQKGFFGKHSHLYHLGCGAKNDGSFWDDHGYIDKDINKALEIDLRYRTSLSYDRNLVKSIFERHFQKAIDNRYVHAIGISNENLVFNWHGGIDIKEKAERLGDIFGSETIVLMVIRNQRFLIESLYKETIRFGYPGSFDDYLKYIWIYRDRNFFYEFCFNKILDIFSRYFKRDNILIFPFEDLKENSDLFLKTFSKSIGIDHHRLKLRTEYNKQLNAKELYIKQRLNAKYPHTFGKDKYSIIDNHRYIPHFYEESIAEIDEILFDYNVRHYLTRLSQDLAKGTGSPELMMKWEGPFAEKILSSYEADNKDLINNNAILRDRLIKYKYINIERS